MCENFQSTQCHAREICSGEKRAWRFEGGANFEPFKKKSRALSNLIDFRTEKNTRGNWKLGTHSRSYEKNYLSPLGRKRTQTENNSLFSPCSILL